MNLIQNTILTALPANKKKTPSGWISFNAPCCVHNGETQDKKKRGGIMTSADGTLSYHCFNCGYKASYIPSRGIGADWYDFMYSPNTFWDVNKRLLIPFYWRGDIVGFTGRMFEKSEKVKYYTDVQPGYVFNMDAQDWTRKFVIVTEGPFDAITISGVSILGSEINDIQRDLIDGLNRQVIVVPDRDAPGEKLINQALEFGWSVAFPEWGEDVDDVADAVLKYGRLFTIQSILKTTESNKFKIDLKRKMYG
jgi:hypothetical protein